jgi:hypothetical protein
LRSVPLYIRSFLLPGLSGIAENAMYQVVCSPPAPPIDYRTGEIAHEIGEKSPKYPLKHHKWQRNVVSIQQLICPENFFASRVFRLASPWMFCGNGYCHEERYSILMRTQASSAFWSYHCIPDTLSAIKCTNAWSVQFFG